MLWWKRKNKNREEKSAELKVLQEQLREVEAFLRHGRSRFEEFSSPEFERREALADAVLRAIELVDVDRA